MDTTSHPPRTAIDRAVKVLGSQTALAQACGKAQGHVSHWLKVGRIPPEYCPAVELATHARGELVPCEDLCQGEPWRRIPDKSWPHPKGRPVLDFASAGMKEAA
ncbi:YdaS family helix-turn-helix protein [Xenophilus sp. Marseille-Q4582]|uniref:YdaS family helix-turn-helix protein n=1 Tax=Xenophilus sp. Marseille-Q4582 TaxID=2866600 RepID=UPI001CE46A76|nr:YdaS family helix-turn-helix protein [Xenophilus sp. Marseille-Q4582]